MKVPETLIRVSRASILGKRFNITEAEKEGLSKAELAELEKKLPTEDEIAWEKIFSSNAPQLARLQRKMSVCIDAEVTELTDDRLTYEYTGKLFEISSPKNAFKICTALEDGNMKAVVELCAQQCVKVDGKNLVDIRADGAILVDELQLLVKIVSKFFFQSFLG